MKKILPLFYLGIALFLFKDLSAQSKSSIALTYLQNNLQKYQLTPSDIADIKQGYEYTDAHNGVTHIYFTQRYNGVEVYNGEINVNIDKNNKIINLGNRFISNIDKKIPVAPASLTPLSAVQASINNIGLKTTEALVQLTSNPLAKTKSEEVLFSKAGIALENISAKLLILPVDDGAQAKLVWKVNIYEVSAQNWWDVFVDAQNGNIIDKKDNVIHCSFEPHYPTDEPGECIVNNNLSPLSPLAANDFNVLNYRVEGPNFSPRTTINSPWNDASADASPFGWLNDGQNNFTYTRGNNVWAYKDVANQNNLAQIQANSANAANLDFNFPIDFNTEPATYQNAATANLFYASNIMHDIFYKYGFNEVSKNFQNNNNGKGGAQNDYVRAESQDDANNCKTRNNANIAVGNDGNPGRMQMYLWNAGNSTGVVVNAPNNIAGTKPAAGSSTFGPCLNLVGTTGDVVYAIPNDGCLAFNNAAAIAGKIALIDRGGCNFTVKVKNAQLAGAIGAIIVNNAPGPPAGMSGEDATINIPALMISQDDGAAIKLALQNNIVVNATIKRTNPELDGDFDNGIIFHEYGHGISFRLTGNQVTCLNNAEQGREGWSDFFALALTHKLTDNATTPRPVATYVMGQTPNGKGLRTNPYSFDMAINPRQYGEVATDMSASPHFIGEIWASTLWDMYWYMINAQGYDPDLYNGTGGNNTAIQLVIDGLKLQPCSPGFLDSRDAILAADQVNNGGANSCAIWNAFARRGMGFSAVQGSSNSKADQVAAFDLPPACQLIVLAVDYVSFTATPKTKSINLEWETANEINTTGFDIQRKSATDNGFVTIGHVTNKGGAGNNSYQYEDKNVQPNVRYFYRIAEKDINNKLSYSETRQAMINNTGSRFIQVFPNLVADQANVRFNQNVTGTVSVNITDVTGRVLYNISNTNFNGNNIKLDMAKYAAGPYFIKVVKDGLIETFKVIKQ